MYVVCLSWLFGGAVPPRVCVVNFIRPGTRHLLLYYIYIKCYYLGFCFWYLFSLVPRTRPARPPSLWAAVVSVYRLYSIQYTLVYILTTQRRATPRSAIQYPIKNRSEDDMIQVRVASRRTSDLASKANYPWSEAIGWVVCTVCTFWSSSYPLPIFYPITLMYNSFLLNLPYSYSFVPSNV